MTKLVALTGNIGSGKSYVSALFAELGTPIFYSDIEAKKMYYVDDIKRQLTERFGNDIYHNDGSLNKERLSSLVFGDKESGRYIERLLYPALDQHFAYWANSQEAPYVIYESAIVFEKGMDKRFDAIITVTASEETRLRRVMFRDACDEASVRKRMLAQWDDTYKTSHSNYVIWHEHDDEDEYLREQVATVDKLIANRQN